MLKILLAIVLVFSCTSSVRADHQFPWSIEKGGDAPFPWGTEAPFPWDSVNGFWRSTQPQNFVFEFSTLKTEDPKTRYLKIAVRNREAKLIAQGIAVVRPSDRILRARVVGPAVDAYSLVRAYDRRVPGRACGNDCALVVTFRRTEQDKGKDVHYVLEKIK